ncbi:sorting nexin-20 isoform X3 [Castor canadensis]|uniref:Sorting nexin-20 isoform X3 n=1 Tax=Castor canadensis TaxID=51338 RepID=A0AC58L4Q5_CASCN
MASPQRPGNPGWMGPITQSTSRTEQEASAMDPDLPCPGPKRLLDDHSGPSSNSSMTTRELQENWQKEKGRWKPVRLLFEIASARIEERRVSKFVPKALSCSPRTGVPDRGHPDRELRQPQSGGGAALLRLREDAQEPPEVVRGGDRGRGFPPQAPDLQPGGGDDQRARAVAQGLPAPALRHPRRAPLARLRGLPHAARAARGLRLPARRPVRAGAGRPGPRAAAAGEADGALAARSGPRALRGARVPPRPGAPRRGLRGRRARPALPASARGPPLLRPSAGSHGPPGLRAGQGFSVATGQAGRQPAPEAQPRRLHPERAHCPGVSALSQPWAPGAQQEMLVPY